MDPLPFTLVMASAVSHALWNYVAKEAGDKDSFMLLINVFSLAIFLPVFYVILPEIYFPVEILPFLFVSGVAETIYFLALGKAYETGDLSVVYPVARSSPMFVAIAASLLIGERISPWGALGIALILFGVYVLHLKGWSGEELTRPLKALGDPASRYAFVAALGTTVYSISDKMGVTAVDPLLYSFWLGFVITGMLSMVIVKRRGVSLLREELRGSLFKVSVAGVLVKGGYMLVLVAMSMAQVSYILALRQVSVVLGAALGVVLLKERYGGVRIVGSMIIFVGVYLLGALA
ncbi:EamA family transporter [Candidatus Bathyarchaeota archaeon]|nr:EamA family transporter [Candidatus Bathyarchaeota archaeon]